MRATKGNLKDQILTGDREILHCAVCGAEYSGNAGDYFMLPDDHIFTHCEQEMELVAKIVTIRYKA